MKRTREYSGIGFTICLILALTMPAAAAKWPKIPQRERELTTLADHPGSPAVVLNERGRLIFESTALTSYLEVYRRVKVLTEEGIDYGSISIFSSDAYRMDGLQGRTHCPDGRVVKLPNDAVFTREYSEYYNRQMTTFAMPEVTVGAIVEYRYVIRFDTVLYPKPWYFQAEIPTLYSEIECVVPSNYSFLPVPRDTLRDHEMEREVKRTGRGVTVTYRMQNVPPVPDEPFRFPFADLASQVTFLPQAFRGPGEIVQLFETWESAIKLFQGDGGWGYSAFRSLAGRAGSKAAELTSGLDNKHDQAEAIYRFVRDEIVTERYRGLGVAEKTANEILREGRGDFAEKALLLQVMLEKAGINASIGWTNPLDVNLVDTKMPNPDRLDTMLVVADVSGEQVYLDIGDRTLGFGMLDPDLQGVPCLLVDRKPYEWVATPLTPPSDSYRHASLQLAIDEDGRLAGSGLLVLTGPQGWQRIGWKETHDEAVSAWQAWLEEQFPDHEISELQVEELLEESRVEVSWHMNQRDEAVLGDEITLNPSAPLSVAENPFVLEPEVRQTPVHLRFASAHTVELMLRWPDGWVIDTAPDQRTYQCAAGHVLSQLSVNQQGRELYHKRELLLSKRDFVGRDEYGILRGLYQTAVANDAATLVLIRD